MLLDFCDQAFVQPVWRKPARADIAAWLAGRSKPDDVPAPTITDIRLTVEHYIQWADRPTWGGLKGKRDGEYGFWNLHGEMRIKESVGEYAAETLIRELVALAKQFPGPGDERFDDAMLEFRDLLEDATYRKWATPALETEYDSEEARQVVLARLAAEGVTAIPAAFPA